MEGHMVWWVQIFPVHEDGCIRVRREAEVMQPSCQLPAAQTDGGSAVAWGHLSCSGLGCVPKEWGQLTNLNFLNDQVNPSMDSFFFSDVLGIFKDDSKDRLTLWKSGSWNVKHHFHTTFRTLNPIWIWDVLKNTCTVVPFSCQKHKIVVKNEHNTGRK